MDFLASSVENLLSGLTLENSTFSPMNQAVPNGVPRHAVILKICKSQKPVSLIRSSTSMNQNNKFL